MFVHFSHRWILYFCNILSLSSKKQGSRMEIFGNLLAATCIGFVMMNNKRLQKYPFPIVDVRELLYLSLFSYKLKLGMDDLLCTAHSSHEMVTCKKVHFHTGRPVKAIRIASQIKIITIKLMWKISSRIFMRAACFRFVFAVWAQTLIAKIPPSNGHQQNAVREEMLLFLTELCPWIAKNVLKDQCRQVNVKKRKRIWSIEKSHKHAISISLGRIRRLHIN